MNIPTKRRLSGLAVAAMLAGLVGGCALGPQNVRTAVTSYNQWPALPADRTYAFSRTLQFQNSVELQSYEAIVGDELARQGFRLASEPASAGLTVTLRPSATSTRIEVRDPWPDPFFAYGYGWGPGWGWGYRGRGWGGYPYWSRFDSFGDDRVEVVHRQLELDIDSTSTPVRRYYEGKVETATRARPTRDVVPYLVRALFVDFPGNNGETRRVDVPVEAR